MASPTVLLAGLASHTDLAIPAPTTLRKRLETKFEHVGRNNLQEAKREDDVKTDLLPFWHGPAVFQAKS